MNRRTADASRQPPAKASAAGRMAGWSTGWPTLAPQFGWVVALTLLLGFSHYLPTGALFTTPAGYLPFHAGLESISIVVSLMVFALAWNLRGQPDNSHRMLLGAGFLAVCLIDIGHTLTYAGMPDLIAPGDTERAIDFWLAGRFVAAALLLAVALLPIAHWSAKACHGAVLAAIAFAAAVYWLGLYRADWFPRTFIAGQGLTGFKIGAEYLLTALYGIAAVLLYLKSRRARNDDLAWLAAAAWVQGLAELFLTLYADVTDLFNLLGHVYKAIAYLMVYRALFVAGIQAPYRELNFERARLQTLLASIPDLVWLKDPDGIYLACNSRFERFFGADAAQILGNTDYDFVARELADAFRAHDLQAMQSKTPTLNEEWVTYADDGHREFLETTKTPMFDAAGRLIGVLGIAHDITARDQAARALRENEQRLQMIANASPALFWSAGLDRGCDWFNQRWLDFTGRSLQQELGDGWTEGVHPDDLARCLATYTDAFDARQPFSMEYRLRRHDGVYRWLIDIGQPRYDADGDFIGYIGSCLDISAEKQLRDQIAQSEVHYRHLFEHNPAPMLIYQRGSLRLKDVNEAFERHYGYRREEALALTLPDLYPPAQRDAIVALAASLHGHAYAGEWQHCKKSGDLIHIVAHSHDLQYQGRDCRVAVITDISAIKQAEQALRQRNAELEQFNAAAVGRELKMIELKREVNQLAAALGRPAPYDIAAIAPDPSAGADPASLSGEPE